MPAAVVASASSALTSANPSVTFPGTYSPAAGDVIVLASGSQSTVAASADSALPAGWVNALGDGAEVNAGAACGSAAVVYVVDEADELAGTLTYTCTAQFTGSETGATHAYAIRGVDVAAIVDNFGVVLDDTAVTPHLLAPIDGAGGLLSGGSLVVRFVFKDATGAYGSAPAGHTQLLSTNTNVAAWSGTLDALTTADTDVPSATIAPSGADQYTSISLAFTSAAAGGPVTIDLGQATETDTGHTVAAAKSRSAGPAAEVDAGAALTAVKSSTLAAAAETDTSTALVAAKIHALAAAAETEIGHPVTATKALAFGQATEADTTTAIAAVKVVVLGVADETDTAGAVTTSSSTSATLGQTDETDAAAAVTAAKAVALGQALEIDTAQPVTTSSSTSVTLGAAAEIDLSHTVAATKTVLLGLAAEFDQAMALVLPSSVTITGRLTTSTTDPPRVTTTSDPARTTLTADRERTTA